MERPGNKNQVSWVYQELCYFRKWIYTICPSFFISKMEVKNICPRWIIGLWRSNEKMDTVSFWKVKQALQMPGTITFGYYLTKWSEYIFAKHHILYFWLSFLYTWSTSLNSSLNFTHKEEISSKKFPMCCNIAAY